MNKLEFTTKVKIFTSSFVRNLITRFCGSVYRAMSIKSNSFLMPMKTLWKRISRKRNEKLMRNSLCSLSLLLNWFEFRFCEDFAVLENIQQMLGGWEIRYVEDRCESWEHFHVLKHLSSTAGADNQQFASLRWLFLQQN